MALLIYNVLLVAIQVASGSEGPPQPKGNTRAPELPIDENIWIIIIVGLLFGIYIAYKKFQTIDKAL